MRCIILYAFLSSLGPLAFAGGLQFQCGPMQGHSYYSDEGLFEGDSGWAANQIKTETVISFDLDDGSIDYRINSLDRWVTPEMEGGSASLVNVDDDSSFQFLAIWPKRSHGNCDRCRKLMPKTTQQ